MAGAKKTRLNHVPSAPKVTSSYGSEGRATSAGRAITRQPATQVRCICFFLSSLLTHEQSNPAYTFSVTLRPSSSSSSCVGACIGACVGSVAVVLPLGPLAGLGDWGGERDDWGDSVDRGDGGWAAAEAADDWGDCGSAGASPAPDPDARGALSTPVAADPAGLPEEPADGASVDATMCSPSCGGLTLLAGDEAGDFANLADLAGDFDVCGEAAAATPAAPSRSCRASAACMLSFVTTSKCPGLHVSWVASL